MQAVRVLLLLCAVVLGLAPGRLRLAPPAAGEAVLRLAPDPAGEPAHPTASARLPSPGLAARPPTPHAVGDGRPAPAAALPAVRYTEPAAHLPLLARRPTGWRAALDHPPYYPTAPPTRSGPSPLE